jgi:hypothetical protein
MVVRNDESIRLFAVTDEGYCLVLMGLPLLCLDLRSELSISSMGSVILPFALYDVGHDAVPCSHAPKSTGSGLEAIS